MAIFKKSKKDGKKRKFTTSNKKTEVEVKSSSTNVEVTKHSTDKNVNKSKKWYEKLPTSFTILFSILFFVVLLSWILTPISQSVSSDTSLWVQPLGIIDPFTSIIVGFIDAIGVILFVFVLGAFLEVILASKTLEVGITSLSKRMKGKEILLIPILFFLFALGGTTYGMQEETVAFFVIIIPFLLLAGFDALTGFMLIVFGTSVGIMTSATNPFSVAVAYDATAAATGIAYTMGEGIAERWINFLIMTTIACVFVTLYARKVHKKPETSMVYDLHDEHMKWARSEMGATWGQEVKMTSRQMTGLWVFIFTFIFMIWSVIPIGEWVGYDSWAYYAFSMEGWSYWFQDNIPWINSMLPIGEWIGGEAAGYWYLVDCAVLFLISTVALGFVFRMKEKELVNTMIEGVRNMLSVGLIIAVSRGIAILLAQSNIDAFLVNEMSSALSTLGTLGFAYVAFVFLIVLAVLIPSTSGLAGAVFPIMGPAAYDVGYNEGMDVAIGDGKTGVEAEDIAISYADNAVSTTVNTYALATGITQFWSPTQGIVFAQCEMSHIPYPRMLPMAAKYFALLFVFSLAIIGLNGAFF